MTPAGALGKSDGGDSRPARSTTRIRMRNRPGSSYSALRGVIERDADRLSGIAASKARAPPLARCTHVYRAAAMGAGPFPGPRCVFSAASGALSRPHRSTSVSLGGGDFDGPRSPIPAIPDDVESNPIRPIPSRPRRVQRRPGFRDRLTSGWFMGQDGAGPRFVILPPPRPLM